MAGRLSLLGAGRQTAIPAASTTLTIQPDETAGVDTFIFGGNNATKNYGIYPNCIVGKGTSLGRGLIKFDVSSIDSGATIISATLSLYIYGGGETSAHNVAVHRALTQWYEGNKNGVALDAGTDGSTWDYRNANGSVVWGTGGGTPGGLADTDYTASATDTTSVSTYNAWYSWDIKADVSAWVAGTATNYGLWVIGTESAILDYKRYYSSDYTDDTTLRPKLIIEYTA